MRSAALLVLSLLGSVAAAACGASAPPSVCASNAPCGTKSGVAGAADSSSEHADPPAVAKVWASRCGSCHVRVEPGTRDRATLETALSRHRNRVRMDESQWSALVGFLAADAR